MTDDEKPMLRYFACEHLPMELHTVSHVFKIGAMTVCRMIPRSPERTVCLRKLLEAKDCAVRAALG